ncbi:MAG: hypothetical protein A2202_09005 [Bdellovibrionales bacterium RIFOXYA1_FULL_36_14]|nr:MAG: hypothetical protein A2202_09005 [Bdellovibrionales bacterium RIFOXYA1_FULL_36_14]
MIQYFVDIFNPDMTFLMYATLIGIFASLAFGTMGTFVVIKRVSFIAGAISHCILGGIGLGMYLNQVHQVTWMTPQIGAILMAVVSALLIGIFTIYYKEREDTLIGALWAFGMALGLILIYYTPGYTDPMSYLFGSILMVGYEDLITVVVLDVLVLTTTILFFNKFVSICFDEEFARLRGINTRFYYLLLLILIAITVVMLINVVGIVMIVAMLTIPSGIASVISKNIKSMIIYSIIISLFTIIAGLSISYQINAPSGPVIIILSSMIYFIAVISFRKKIL